MEPERVLVIGSGTRFISGISHYTHALACAFSARHKTSVILLRGLLPRSLYPGASRVGASIAHHEYPPGVRVYDGVDWYWLPSLIGALQVIWSERPTVAVLQWWTGAVAHTYIALAVAARLRGARVVLEVHEVQDTGEARIPLASTYTRFVFRVLVKLADGMVAHSESDREVLACLPQLTAKRIEVIHHGPFNHYGAPYELAMRQAPEDCLNVMFFGTIRPYKGLEDLVRAFDALPDPTRYWLTIVGETWEGWTQPAELIANSPNADRITFVNHYVTDQEASRWLAGADALALPYHRSSASGPLHIGMALGLPIITSDIASLVEAADGYDGCSFVPPRDIEGLRNALIRLEGRAGRRFADPRSWDETLSRYESLITLANQPAS